MNAVALVLSGNDVPPPNLTSMYLKNAQAIDSLALLPAPPEVGSIAFLDDQAMYEQGRLQRNTERGKLAAEEANLSSGDVAIALVLAEVNPARQNEILKRGFDLGQRRVICGYHWQSDVDAAHIVGSAVVATLHTSPAFQQQLQKAKDVFAKAQKS